MTTNITDLPTLEECYETACTSSDLGVSQDHRGDADILIASAWSDARLGGELARLHTKQSISALINITAQLHRRCEKHEITGHQAGKVLLWWLDQTCPACDGHGKTKIPGAPSLSGHNCQACNGTGKKRIPAGEDGKWLANLMDASVATWRRSLSGRFRHQNIEA